MRKYSKQSADLTADPHAPVEGMNGIKQAWEDIWSNKEIAEPRTGFSIFETLAKDQFGNHYISYTARLKDHETYQVGEWIKPSVVCLFGGFNVQLLDSFRRKAFLAFSETDAKL